MSTDERNQAHSQTSLPLVLSCPLSGHHGFVQSPVVPAEAAIAKKEKNVALSTCHLFLSPASSWLRRLQRAMVVSYVAFGLSVHVDTD